MNSKIILIGLVLLNILLRLPSVFLELPPQSFVDETLYAAQTYQMYLNHTLHPNHYLSGGFSTIFPLIGARLWDALTHSQISERSFVIYSRLLMPVLLSSLSAPLIFLATRRLFQNISLALLAAGLFTASPMALGISRIVYPDHYIVFFSSFLLFVSVCLLTSPVNLKQWKLYLLAGLTVGTATATKYNGILLCIPFVFAHILNGTNKTQNLSTVTRLKLIVWDKKILLPFLIVPLTFWLWTPYIFQDWQAFIRDFTFNFEHYKVGHAGIESPHGIWFYTQVLFFTSFGILGGIIYLFGLTRGAIYHRQTIALLNIFPWFLVLCLGRYRVVTNRNVVSALPFVIITLAYGLYHLQAWLRVKLSNSNLPLRIQNLVWTFLGLTFFIEPVGKTLWSLRHDFLPDARIAAMSWIRQHIPPNQAIGFHQIGWGTPIPEEHKLIRVGFPPEKPLKQCFNYFVIDGWSYEHRGMGNNMFLIPVYSEVFFLNPTQVKYPEIRIPTDTFLLDYILIQKFDSGYYGPSISIYKKKESCLDI